MKCPRCQAENDAGARFCEDCGARLEAACPSCGTPVTPGKKFCRSCGAALTTEPAGRFASPESYTPKYLAEKILTSKAALEGERKQVTVLFADLKGSMELLADRDPEEARKLLDPVLERMMEAVHRYEGTVNQVMGDGIMALFGAPLAHEDHAVRACYAALRMQESVKRYADEARRSHGVEVQIRVGLNSGEVVVRSVGSDLRMDYTAVGQTTHLAARMEQLAAPGSIRLTAATLHLAEGFVQVTPLGLVPVKGLGEPVEVFELVGAGAARTRFEVAARRGLTRFVGRNAELEELQGALDRASLGNGQVVAVVGEPGVGKSRLLWEFTHSHRSQGWLVLETASVSYGKATAYFPVIELLRSYFGIEPRDDDRKMREKVTGKLLSLDRVLEPALPVFLSLLDVPVGDAEWTKLDPPQRRRQTLDALKRLLLRESQVQPVLLAAEDLHWIDSETQAWLDLLVDSLPAARLLLLVNYRPEYGHGWGSKTYYQQVRLDALPTPSAEELLDALLGAGPGLTDLRRLLIDRTQGNPFFLEEGIRALVESGALTGERGGYQLAEPVQSFQLPATVQAILAARIDRLTLEDRRLLQAAAVVGKDVPFPLLEAIADEPEPRLRDGLARLQAAEFLYEARLFPDLEYTFKHALTHEVAYGSLLEERRRMLHARVVDAVERQYSDRLDEQAERLAHHAVAARMWEKATIWLPQAANRAIARSAYREAVAFAAGARTALSHLPETPERLAETIDVLFQLRTGLWPYGERERSFGHLQEAERLATRLGDQRRLCTVYSLLAIDSWQTGPTTRAQEFARKAIASVAASTHSGFRLNAQLILGQVTYDAGDYRRAETLLRPAATSLRADEDLFGSGVPSLVRAYAYLAGCLGICGNFAEASAVGLSALHIAEEIRHHYGSVLARGRLAHVLTIKGEVERAVTLLEHALSECHKWELLRPTAFVETSLGHAYVLSGRVPDGLALLRQGIAAFHANGWGILHALAEVHHGEACLLAGSIDEARRCAEHALTLARSRAERGWEAYARWLLGDVTSSEGLSDANSRRTRHVEAEEHYGDALALAERLAMRPLVAHCHLGLGKLYRQAGKRQEARQHLTTAETMFGEMDMRHWREQAEREMKESA